MKKLNSI